MKKKITLIALFAMMSQVVSAGVGGPPSIFYEQFFDRGNELKKDYRDVPGGAQAYEEYNEKFKKKVDGNAKKNNSESYDDVSQTTNDLCNNQC